jgi:hypothetical protein
MGLFSKLLKKKEAPDEPSNFFHYMSSATKKKSDSKIYEAIFTRKVNLDQYNDLTVARLRARSGISLEDAKVLLG